MTATTKNTSCSAIIFGYAIIAFCIACTAGLMIKGNNSELTNYKKTGIEAAAKVLSKSRTREGSKKVLTNHIQVSYSIGSLVTDDFEVVITEITKFVTDDLWEKTEPGDTISVVYLKTDPEGHTILKESLSALDSQLFVTFLPAVVPAIAGVFLTGLAMIFHARKI